MTQSNDSEVSSDTPRILSSSPRRGTAQKKEFVLYHVSNLFWIFLLQTNTHIFLSIYGNGKEQQVTKAFTIVCKRRPFTDQIITIREFWVSASILTRENTKRLPPTLDISYQLPYFRHKHQRHALF